MRDGRHHGRSERAEPAWVIGSLCIAGDRARASGDLLTLARIAVRLASYAHEPLHCELVALADRCRTAPDRSVTGWSQLRDRLLAACVAPRP